MTAAAIATLPWPFGFAMGDKHSLARLETAMWWLEIDEGEVFGLIADRALVAFNLAGPGAERHLPGIWSRSLHEYMQKKSLVPGVRRKRREPPTATVVADILPPGQRDVRLREVRRALGIKRKLLHELLEAALLAAVPGTGDKVNKAPLIRRASVVEFLYARRM